MIHSLSTLLLFANNRNILGGMFGIEKNEDHHYCIRDCTKFCNIFVKPFISYGNGEHKMAFETPEEIFQYTALGKTEAVNNMYCLSNLCLRSHRICVLATLEVLPH